MTDAEAVYEYVQRNGPVEPSTLRRDLCPDAYCECCGQPVDEQSIRDVKVTAAKLRRDHRISLNAEWEYVIQDT